MRAKKMLTYITGGCALVSAIIALVISKSIWYDYSMAIFGSALLGFIMSVTEYFVERRRAMETFMTESSKALAKLRKIKYLDTDAPLDKIIACFWEEQHNERVKSIKSMGDVANGLSIKEEHPNRDDLISWFKKNKRELTSVCDNSQLIAYYESAMEKYRQDSQVVIDSCLFIATIDLEELDKAYGNLDFFLNCDIRHKLAYPRIYTQIRKYRELANEAKHHFQSLKEGKGNFTVCVELARDICNIVFEVKESSKGNHITKNVFQTVFDNIEDALDDFWCKTYHKKLDGKRTHDPIEIIMHTSLGESDSHG